VKEMAKRASVWEAATLGRANTKQVRQMSVR